MDPQKEYSKFYGVWTAADQAPIPNSEPDPPVDTTWTVTRSDVTRGNLGGQQSDAEVPKERIRWPSVWPPYPPKNGDPAFGFHPTASWAELNANTDGESTPRPRDARTVYPYPNLSLPHPSLSLDFRMSIKLGDRIPVGFNTVGRKTWISFTGGSWSGTWGTGIVLPGGQDSETTLSNGASRLDAKFLLQTHESSPAYITVKASGWTTGPMEVLQKLTNVDIVDSVDSSTYSFKLSVELETADERYRDKINCGMWVGSGIKRNGEIIFDAYRIS